jgi:hypothetical protein
LELERGLLREPLQVPTNVFAFCAEPSIVVNPIVDCCNVELKPMIAVLRGPRTLMRDCATERIRRGSSVDTSDRSGDQHHRQRCCLNPDVNVDPDSTARRGPSVPS